MPIKGVLRQSKATLSMTKIMSFLILVPLKKEFKQEFSLEDYRVQIKTMQQLIKESACIYNTEGPHFI